ncbi:membrane protein [Geobacter sulfurreducens]|nr:membrane protein [Geobacter sulfurreducens]
MILHPAVIALFVGSLLTSGMLVATAFFAVKILRHWDLASGSERQLSFERRTYLLATIMTCCCVFQLLSLFLFIHVADSLSALFPGAMCAAGTLNLNRFGYPTLVLKITTFLLAGFWLILNHADNQGYDYPLIRIKYSLLLVITPLLLAETGLQGGYFLSLQPRVITSCCGSLFGGESSGMVPTLTTLGDVPALATLGGVLTLTLICGGIYLWLGRMGYLFAALSATTFAVGVVGLLSAIPVYIYALPTHHCPFCMLHGEYGHVGYLLYATLLGGGVAGVGMGGLQPFRRVASLASSLPMLQRRLVLSAMLCYGLFGGITAWQVMVSELRLG